MNKYGKKIKRKYIDKEGIYDTLKEKEKESITIFCFNITDYFILKELR
jgi:hypothetical protein